MYGTAYSSLVCWTIITFLSAGNASCCIKVSVIPPCVRQFDLHNLPQACDQFEVKQRNSTPIVLPGTRTKAWRRQYHLSHFVSTTVQKSIGATLPYVATKLSLQDNKYRLWELEQMLVILSRVPSLNDITFVTTDPEDTIASILNKEKYADRELFQ